MKKTFQKSLIAVAALAAMSASFAADKGTSNILFPYVSTGANAVTLITLASGGLASAPTYRYAMKTIGAANSVGCDHQDGTSSLTANDVVQFEVSNKFAANTAFANGDTSVGYNYTGGAGKHGFLIINTGVAAAMNAIYGEALVIDAASGLRLSYSSQGLNTTDTTAGNPDFTLNNGGAITGGPASAPVYIPSGSSNAHGANIVTWLNTAAVTTSWFVLPLGTMLEMTPSGAIGGLTAAFSMTDTGGATGQFGAYNMTETFTSGGLVTSARCIGAITRSDTLMPGAISNTAAGGMAVLNTYNGGTTTALQDGGVAGGTTGAVFHKALVYKLQSAGTGANALGFISREADK